MRCAFRGICTCLDYLFDLRLHKLRESTPNISEVPNGAVSDGAVTANELGIVSCCHGPWDDFGWWVHPQPKVRDPDLFSKDDPHSASQSSPAFCCSCAHHLPRSVWQTCSPDHSRSQFATQLVLQVSTASTPSGDRWSSPVSSNLPRKSGGAKQSQPFDARTLHIVTRIL